MRFSLWHIVWCLTNVVRERKKKKKFFFVSRAKSNIANAVVMLCCSNGMLVLYAGLIVIDGLT